MYAHYEMRSLAKIAAAFKVSRKTVSLWLGKFRDETGFQVVTHSRHVSVREHAHAELNEVEEE